MMRVHEVHGVAGTKLDPRVIESAFADTVVHVEVCIHSWVGRDCVNLPLLFYTLIEGRVMNPLQ